MNHRIVAAAVALAVLSGCDSGAQCFSGTCENAGNVGGGGGGSLGLMTIDENNALTALREAWFAATATAGVPVFVVATGVGDTSGGVAKGGPIASKLGSNGSVYVDPFGPTVYNCPVSGTFTVSGDVADPNTVTTGDFVNYSSSACDSGTGYTVNGDHGIQVTDVSGDVASGQYVQSQTLTMNTFQAASGTLTTTLTGDHDSTLDTSNASFYVHTFSGTSLSVNEGGVSILITGFSGQETADTGSPFDYTLDVAGRANSSLINGAFDYATDETILQQGSQWPHDGILEIYGANTGTARGTARVAVSDEFNVYVQVDANGNTNHEVSILMTWEEFLGL